MPLEVREAARAHTVMCIERLAFWANSSDPKASVAAAQALLNRAYGMPSQPLTDGEGQPLALGSRIEVMLVAPPPDVHALPDAT